MRRLIVTLVGALLFLAGPFDAAHAQREGSKNVRLVFQLIEANGFTDVDPAIGDVVEELQKLFRFNGYRLSTTSVLNGVVGEHVNIVSQRLMVGERGKLQLEAWLYSLPDPAAIRVIVNLRDARYESTYQGSRVPLPEILDVSVNIRNGQTIILGSARPTASSEALILVMRAEFDPQ